MWPAWRLVMEGKATLSELDARSIDDVLEANRILDAWQDAQAKAAKRKAVKPE